MRKKLAIILPILVLLLAAAWWHFGVKTASAPTKPNDTARPTHQTKSDNFNKQQYSLTNPTSIWVIVNKSHPLNPISYAPSDLRYPNVTLRVPGLQEMEMRTVAATALEQMFAGAAAASYKLEVSTAYRSYSYQQSLYSGYVSSAGQAAADQESARPGYSEHQTGLAVDIRSQNDTCSLEACFGTTPEGEWLAANAYKYGFLLRYPQGKEAVTGYEYEPWHFRYIGTGLSYELHKDHIQTLEGFFGVSGGTVYKAAA